MTDPVVIQDGRAWEIAQCERLLRPYAKVDGATGALLPLDGWATLTCEGQVLVALIAARLAYLVNTGPATSPAIMPAAIEDMIGRPGGSVRPALKRLMAMRVIYRYQSGAYYVPATSFARIRARWLPLAAAQTDSEEEASQ